jgi:hypothetical protein
MAYDMLSQVVDEIKSCPSGMFSIQLDESTDVTHLAHLLVYVRNVYNDDIKTEFLLCKPLETTTTARDIFKVVSNVFEEHGIEWKNVCAVCTDGSPAMLGCRSEFQALIKTVTPNATGTHCVIHRQLLAAKTLPSGLKQIMSLVIQAVNFIKSSALSSRILTKLCFEMNAESTKLLLYTEVRWLSKGKVLKRVYDLHEELAVFFTEKGKMEFKDLFSQDEKLNQITYLADMFGLSNQLNISLQGHNSSIIDLYDKTKSFQMKVDLWLSKLKGKKTYMFPVLAARLEESNNGTGLNESLISEIKVHSLCLKEELSRYFPYISNKLFPLVKSPFTFDFEEIPEIAQEELIEMRNVTGIKSEFSSFSETQFWVRRLLDYSALAKTVLKILLPFPTTYECEEEFSSLLKIKTKHRSRLNVEYNLRCALSSTSPRIKKLAVKEQAQPSH